MKLFKGMTFSGLNDIGSRLSDIVIRRTDSEYTNIVHCNLDTGRAWLTQDVLTDDIERFISTRRLNLKETFKQLKRNLYG